MRTDETETIDGFARLDLKSRDASGALKVAMQELSENSTRQ